MADFNAQISKWAQKTEQRIEAVVKEATQSIIEDMNTPQAKGGRMPVDTGFLRNSGQINGMPPMVGLLQWDPATNAIEFGWTAEYAPYMDARYGFMRLAVQDWPQFVSDANRTVKRQYG